MKQTILSLIFGAIIGVAYTEHKYKPYVEELDEAFNVSAEQMISRGIVALAEAGADDDDISYILSKIRSGETYEE